MPRKYTKETAVGIFVMVGLACVAYLTLQLGDLELFGSDVYRVSADFTSVAGLRAGASVEIAGVPVGKVGAITLEQEHAMAHVVLEINNTIKLSDDVIASIKTSGLIGDKYVSLSPGGSTDYLGDGDVISDTESAVDLEALISKYVFGGVK